MFHNFGKAYALKMSYWHLNVDQVDGAYVEFGVASGNSMRSAEIAERRSHSNSLGIRRVRRNLYGFDTFSEFSSQSLNDSHKVWSKFIKEYQEIKYRNFFQYSDGGIAFQITISKTSQ